MMKANVYTEYGPPEVLKYTEVEMPSVGEDEVLVKIEASSINFGDAARVKGSPFVARFWSGLFKPKYPIPGGDIAGRVEAAGGRVTQFRQGDEVYADIGHLCFGSYAEYSAVPEKEMVLKPTNATFA